MDRQSCPNNPRPLDANNSMAYDQGRIESLGTGGVRKALQVPLARSPNPLQIAINGIRRERSAAFGRKAAIGELSAKPARP